MPFSTSSFHAPSALAAGVAGTAALLGFQKLLPRLAALEIALDWRVYGRLAPVPALERPLRWGGPFVTGALFGLGYAALWARGLGRPTIGSAAAFGAAHGLATTGLRVLLPRDADLPPPPVWVVGEALDHALYAVVTGAVYRALTA